MGKTSIATKFPRHLLIAFEKGYSAIPGAMPQPIFKWSEFKQVLKVLKTPEAHEMYETIIIDTADIAYDYCDKYICDNAGVDNIKDIPYGAGYQALKKEFDECLRSIVKMDYGLVIISHAEDKTFKDENGQEFNQIVPTLNKAARNVVSRMVDIIGYSRTVQMEDGSLSTKLFMRGTPRYMAGSRFKYTPNYIDFTYKALVQAIRDAIDKQMEEDGAEYFTDSRDNVYEQEVSYDYDTLIKTFNTMIQEVMERVPEEEFTNYYYPRITEITDRYLGKGHKVSETSREQVEALSLIIDDLKELF